MEKKEAELEEARKRVADVTENLKIAEERTEHALAEREKFAERSKEFITRIEQMQDELKDKQIQLEDHEMQMKRQTDELKVVKMANETYQKKIANIYDNNIIIAKERASDDPNTES